jgi:hypothetical protein
LLKSHVYFAGHMAVAQMLDRALTKKVSFSLPLVFAAAMLPDMDFVFYQYFPHHTITHSLPFWLVIYAPVIAIWRWKAAPYAIATFSHFLIGDVIAGNPPLLYGFSDARFGVLAPWIFAHYGAQSGMLYQSAVDAAASALFVVAAFGTKSVRTAWTGAHDPRHVLILLAVVAAIFFGAARSEIATGLSQSSGMSYAAYAVIALSHAIFVLPFLFPVRGKELPVQA